MGVVIERFEEIDCRSSQTDIETIGFHKTDLDSKIRFIERPSKSPALNIIPQIPHRRPKTLTIDDRLIPISSTHNIPKTTLLTPYSNTLTGQANLKISKHRSIIANIKINNKIYNDIIYLYYPIANTDDWIRKIYYAKHIGVVKFEEENGRVWELIRHKVKQ